MKRFLAKVLAEKIVRLPHLLQLLASEEFLDPLAEWAFSKGSDTANKI